MDVHIEKEHHKESQKEQKDSKDYQSGRPRAGSESSRNPVSKVMDLIRHRSHSALSAEDKRKAVSKHSFSRHKREEHAEKSGEWSHLYPFVKCAL